MKHKFFLFGLFRDEGRERPTGGLADYRQVKPWKKRDIAKGIVRFALNFANATKPFETRRRGGIGGRGKLPATPKIAKKSKLIECRTGEH
jgi:hypothetical protein